MVVSCIVYMIKREIFVENRDFFISMFYISIINLLSLWEKTCDCLCTVFFHNRARSLEYLVVQLNSAKSPLFTQSIRALRHGQTDRRK